MFAYKTLKSTDQMNTDEVTKINNLSRKNVTPYEVVPEKPPDPQPLGNGTFEFQIKSPYKYKKQMNIVIMNLSLKLKWRRINFMMSMKLWLSVIQVMPWKIKMWKKEFQMWWWHKSDNWPLFPSNWPLITLTWTVMDRIK